MSFITDAFKQSDFNPVELSKGGKISKYNTVAERLKVLCQSGLTYQKKSDYEATRNNEGEVDGFIIKVTLKIYNPELKEWLEFEGLAQETIEKKNYKLVNYASALENAETSALGRALGSAGIGLTGEFASLDEMKKDIEQAESKMINNDELVFEKALEHENSCVKNIANQIFEMADDNHRSRIKMLNELTLKQGNSKTKDWMIQDFGHLLNIYKGSISNERYKEALEFNADRVDMAYSVYRNTEVA